MTKKRGDIDDFRGRGLRSKAARWLAPAICAVAAIAALLAGAAVLKRGGGMSGSETGGAVTEERAVDDGGDDADSPAAREDEGVVDAEAGEDDSPRSADDGGAARSGGSSGEDGGDAAAGDSGATTTANFLMRLDALADKGGGGADEVSIEFEVASDLVAAGSGVLEAYRETKVAELLAHGYLDLKGNAWGAIVRGGDDWVDVVVIQGSADDAVSTVRIERMLASEDGRETL